MNEEFQQEPVESERDRALRWLAREYHERAEAYDRSVCTGPIVDGSILPVGAREFALVNRHAHELIQELMRRSGVSKMELLVAIGRAA